MKIDDLEIEDDNSGYYTAAVVYTQVLTKILNFSDSY